MVQSVYYTQRPEDVLCAAGSHGGLDVWLRKNVTEVQRDGLTLWQADEVNFHTDLSEETVRSEADRLFVCPPGEANYSDRERIAALERAVRELAEVIADG